MSQIMASLKDREQWKYSQGRWHSCRQDVNHMETDLMETDLVETDLTNLGFIVYDDEYMVPITATVVPAWLSTTTASVVIFFFSKSCKY